MERWASYRSKPAAAPQSTPVFVCAPAIAGVWEIPVDTAKGEKAWRLIVRQTPAETYATVLRIDGDTGTISGGFADGAFHLSRFAGDRPPALLTITPQADGTLGLILINSSGRHDLKALRPAAARTAGLDAPNDPTRHTGVQSKAEAFRFSGVEIGGKTVTNADPRFKGKVVLVNIMGSWCPNCHDEAPFLAELDAEYHARGLEVVSLAFEGADQLKSLDRLKAFVSRYNLRYDILVGGERSQVNERLPQAVNLNAWPTTFFLAAERARLLDRSGKVHSVHVGFPSQGQRALRTSRPRAQISREIEGPVGPGELSQPDPRGSPRRGHPVRRLHRGCSSLRRTGMTASASGVISRAFTPMRG